MEGVRLRRVMDKGGEDRVQCNMKFWVEGKWRMSVEVVSRAMGACKKLSATSRVKNEMPVLKNFMNPRSPYKTYCEYNAMQFKRVASSPKDRLAE